MMKVAGYNYKCLCANWNLKTKEGYRIVCPPNESNLDISSLISYSVYCYHAVWITKDGHAFAIGDNIEKQIYECLPKHFIEYKTEVTIQDNDRNTYIPISAVCGRFYTLYLVKSPKGQFKLAYVHSKNNGVPIFLDLNDHNPIALFGGMSNCAVVTDNGSIIIITKAILDSPHTPLESIPLPDGEKTTYVACCDDYIFALSNTGKVYQYRLMAYCPSSSFSEVKKLKGKRFVSLSGTFKSCFAVTDNGLVYGHGSNDHGKLGLGRDMWGTDGFKKIKSLQDYKITNAYAGCFHSIFKTDDGKIVGFGWNRYGELLVDIDPNEDCVFTPTVANITGDVTYCDVGDSLSAVYVGCEPPINSPNQLINEKRSSLEIPVLRVGKSSFPPPKDLPPPQPKEGENETSDSFVEVDDNLLVDETPKYGSYTFWIALILFIILSFYLFH